MLRSAQRGLHNTNHWGAVIPNMNDPGQDQGSNFDPSCQAGRRPSPPLGSECRAAQEHVLRAFDRVEKELMRAMERNWMQFFRALMGRRSCPHTSASRPASLNTTDNQCRPAISAWRRQKVFKAPLLTAILDAPLRKLVRYCASHKIEVG
jgi:hypothetical protein